MHLRSNIIIRNSSLRRAFSHHYEHIKYPVSSCINYFSHLDKIKLDETNKNVNELISRLETIDKNVSTIDFYVFTNLLVNCMFVPALILLKIL